LSDDKKPEKTDDEENSDEKKPETPEKKENNDKKPEEPKKRIQKGKPILVRLPVELAEALDKSCKKQGKTAAITQFVRDGLEKNGGKIEEPVDYKSLEDKEAEIKKDMAAVHKAMGHKFEVVNDLAIHLADGSLEPKKIPAIAKLLLDFTPERKHNLTKSDIEAYIPYLESKIELSEIEKQLKPLRAQKYEKVDTTIIKKDAKDFIPKQQSDRDRIIDHNRGCENKLDTGYAFANKDALKEGGVHWNDERRNTPEKLFELVKKYEQSTNAEEKEWITEYLKKEGTKADKVAWNTYLKTRLFPIAFPECDTYFLGKLTTEDLTSEKARARILPPEARDLCIKQKDRHADDYREKPKNTKE